MRQVSISPVPVTRLTRSLSPERTEQFVALAERARAALAGRVVWNVNATATGGGVAEMLPTLLAYGLGAGVDTRWLVLDADPHFFTITKRLHNLLHGVTGDGGPLAADERAHYERALAANLEEMLADVRTGDLVVLHDPQTAGMVDGLRAAGARVVWRCHIGLDGSNDLTDRAWSFLRPYVEPADAVVFSRQAYAPDWVDPQRLWVIRPSIDALSCKNVDLDADEVAAILHTSGLLAGDGFARSTLGRFTGRSGSAVEVHSRMDLVLGGSPPPADARVVLQVSRWDRLKDMAGVMTAFAYHLREMADVHLMLVGPDAWGVTDDPEGTEVLAECRALWNSLPERTRRRIHVVCLPMEDVDANALMVNALQRHAYLVAQKSIVEGFGLTVTEAMWKSRPVLASAVGGIRDQITDGVDGVLVDDPTDLAAFAAEMQGLLDDPVRAERLGRAGREHVRDEYLADRHLTQYENLLTRLATGR